MHASSQSQPEWEMRFYSGCLIVLLLVSCWGCSRPTVSDYVPLAAGMIREYRLEISEPGSGKEKQIRSGTVISRYAVVEMIKGKEYMKVLTFHQGLPGTPDTVSWLRCATNGVYQIVGKKDNSERLLFPLPPRVGLTWTVAESDGKTVGSIEAVENVDLPECSYPDCFRMKIDRYDHQERILYKNTFWLAKGSGFVKAESESLSNGAKTKTWLTKLSSAP